MLTFNFPTAHDHTPYSARAKLLEDEDNRAVLEVIESALMVVVLAEEEAGDLTALVHNLLIGQKNIWFDKYTLMVYRDGRVGANVEHTPTDGTVCGLVCSGVFCFCVRSVCERGA